MGWSHPDISMEDLLNLIKGFVDMLILASGYQSSGRLAHWDSHNIKKLLQWGLFFENVFRRLSYLDDYQGSMMQLDAALSELKSIPHFPEGLAHLSSITLSKATEFVLEYLTQALPLREAHFRASMTAAIEMDLDELRKTENDCLHVYLDKLMQQNTSVSPVFERRVLTRDSVVSSPHIDLSRKSENCGIGHFTKFNIQEIMRRQSAVSNISSAEMALDGVSKMIRENNWNDFDNSPINKQPKHAIDPLTEEELVDYITSNHWKTRNLSYLLDKRTIRLVSGARLIFSTPKILWVQMFERLNSSSESCDDDLLEIMELMLLGCIGSRWNSLIEHFMSVPYDSLTISNQYHEVCKLLQGRFQNLHSKEEMVNFKEKDILEYLTVLLGSQFHQLWKLSPILAAVAIPSWSPLFRLYLSELESQYKGGSSTISYCDCFRDRKEHKDCVLAERIWCLYIFHVRGSHISYGSDIT